jgi:hypothetical protein
MNCKNFRNELPDLLLDAGADRNPAAVAHMQVCPPCKQEFGEYRAMFGLLDTWKVPETSAYFDQKLAVRMREEQAEPAMGWLERMKTHLLYNTGRNFRPALAGALCLVLLVGGGTIAELPILHPARVQASATIDDLQILDRNEQAFQQMDLLQDDDRGSNNSNQAPQADQPIS